MKLGRRDGVWACRCEALRAAFGRGAPAKCGPCALRDAHEALILLGFVAIEPTERGRLETAGLGIEGTADGVSWAPRWAAGFAREFGQSRMFRPIMQRAAADETFRAALQSLLRMTPPPSAGPKVYEFAKACGVTFE